MVEGRLRRSHRSSVYLHPITADRTPQIEGRYTILIPYPTSLPAAYIRGNLDIFPVPCHFRQRHFDCGPICFIVCQISFHHNYILTIIRFNIFLNYSIFYSNLVVTTIKNNKSKTACWDKCNALKYI